MVIPEKRLQVGVFGSPERTWIRPIQIANPDTEETDGQLHEYQTLC